MEASGGGRVPVRRRGRSVPAAVRHGNVPRLDRGGGTGINRRHGLIPRAVASPQRANVSTGIRRAGRIPRTSSQEWLILGPSYVPPRHQSRHQWPF